MTAGTWVTMLFRRTMARVSTMFFTINQTETQDRGRSLVILWKKEKER
jgi:hypothetical protein